MTFYRLENRIPQVDPSGFVAPSADVIGSVILEEQASVWFNAVVRGDNDIITIGKRSNVQDNSVLHVDPGIPIIIGSNVTIGHCVMLHGCTIGNGSLIGIGSIILNHATIGESCIVGANTLITERKTFPPRSLIVGSPGRVVRELNDHEVQQLAHMPQVYVDKTARYQELEAIPLP